jgi:PAS domain S-box-containing protein
MQNSGSNVRRAFARAGESRDDPSKITGIPGNPQENEFPMWKVMDAIPGFIWTALPDGQGEFCNRNWLEYTGMSLNEVKGWGWTAAIHSEDMNELRQRWESALKQGTSLEAQARLRRADGSYRWFSIQASPHHLASGEISRWYGISTDIEGLKRAEETQKRTSYLDELVEQAPEAIAILSTDDLVIRVNKEFTRLFGYEPDELLYRPIYDFIIPETLIESSMEFTRQLKEGNRIEVETIRRRKDGNPVHVSLLVVPIITAAGEQAANYAIYRDITARKLAEERLRESEARFQAMADTAPVMIWMTGTDGLCNYFNKPWLDFTGRTMEQEVGTGWVEGVYPDDVQGCFDCFLSAFHARKAFTMEYRLKRADGEFRWVIESGIPRYTGDGDFAGYIGSNIDITDRKRAEEERERLRQLQADLAHINRVSTLGELTASLAHEIKQPISAAAMDAHTCLKWLVRDQPDIQEARESAARMIVDVTRASEIINRTRSLFKKEETQRDPVDLNEIIREMIELLRSEAIRCSLSIHTELEADLPKINADRVQLQQVLMNLMLNAIDAMNEASAGRKLTIKSQWNPDDQLLISVSDTGVGLPTERADKIFEAFFTTKPQGTGMGLSISRSIIESHGGRLWATTNPEQGTTFQFTLPTDFNEA